MARQTMTIIDTVGPQRVPLNEIPEDVKKYVEDTYAKQRKTPSRERAIYDTTEELAAEFKLMVDYAAQRPAGVLAIRRSPTRKTSLPKNLQEIADRVMDWRVTADIPANGAANGGTNPKQSSAAK